jgi:hypothetical protein
LPAKDDCGYLLKSFTIRRFIYEPASNNSDRTGPNEG